MKYYIMIWVIALLLIIFPSSSLAHTYLNDSSPKDGEVVVEELQEITLFFGTKIENGSKFEVTNNQGETIDVDKIIIEQDTMTGTFSSPLENSTYLVLWKIIGADGHPIEGSFSFEVDVPEQVNNVELPGENGSDNATENNGKQEVTNGETDQAEKDTPNQGEEAASNPEVSQSTTQNSTLLIGIGVIGAIAIAWLLLRRRRG